MAVCKDPNDGNVLIRRNVPGSVETSAYMPVSWFFVDLSKNLKLTSVEYFCICCNWINMHVWNASYCPVGILIRAATYLWVSIIVTHVTVDAKKKECFVSVFASLWQPSFSDYLITREHWTVFFLTVFFSVNTVVKVITKVYMRMDLRETGLHDRR